MNLTRERMTSFSKELFFCLVEDRAKINKDLRLIDGAVKPMRRCSILEVNLSSSHQNLNNHLQTISSFLGSHFLKYNLIYPIKSLLAFSSSKEYTESGSLLCFSTVFCIHNVTTGPIVALHFGLSGDDVHRDKIHCQSPLWKINQRLSSDGESSFPADLVIVVVG